MAGMLARSDAAGRRIQAQPPRRQHIAVPRRVRQATIHSRCSPSTHCARRTAGHASLCHGELRPFLVANSEPFQSAAVTVIYHIQYNGDSATHALPHALPGGRRAAAARGWPARGRGRRPRRPFRVLGFGKVMKRERVCVCVWCVCTPNKVYSHLLGVL